MIDPVVRKTALLLIAHGSRRSEANADLYYLAEQMRARSKFDLVQVSFLELTEPTIDVGGEKCVHEGATEVIMLPYFLSAGVHARDDMEEARQKLREKFPEVTFRLAEPLGRHPLLLDVVEERATAAR